jgi:hypothetical protein
MRRALPITILLALAFLPAAFADSLLTPVQVTYLSAGVNQWGGYWAYPYTVAVGNSGTTMAMMCDDFLGTIQANESWTAHAVTLTSSALLAIGNGTLPSYFGTRPGGVQLYEQAAHIFSQVVSGEETRVGSANAAVWKLFDSALNISGDGDAVQILSNASLWLAGLNGSTASFNNVALFVPDLTQPISGQYLDHRPQEFIAAFSGGFTPQSTTPEPATFLPVLGAGLALIAVGRGRRKRS